MSNGSVVLFSCFGDIMLVPIINEIENAGIYCKAVIIDGVINERDRTIERSRVDRSLTIPELYDLNMPTLPFYFVNNHNSKECCELVNRLETNYLVNAGLSRIIKEDILNCTKGFINCHPALIPQYRGCTCLEWSIYNGSAVGATAHFMNLLIDEGPIIYSEIMEVNPFENYELIRTKMLFHQARVMAKAILICLKEDLRPEKLPQQTDGNYYKPIPLEKLLEVKSRLLRGEYSSKCPVS